MKLILATLVLTTTISLVDVSLQQLAKLISEQEYSFIIPQFPTNFTKLRLKTLNVRNYNPCNTAANKICSQSRYRALDGSCNNLKYQFWGAAMQRYNRLLPPSYEDGISAPTVSITGKELPSARNISLTMFGEKDVKDDKYTLATMQWGQLVAHDMSKQAGGTVLKKHEKRCCTVDGKMLPQSIIHKSCYPIKVLNGDPVFSRKNMECMNFIRTITDLDAGCQSIYESGEAEQLSEVTAFIDLSLIYGNSITENRPLRTFKNGEMIAEERNEKRWPPKNPNAIKNCDVDSSKNVCYLTGDRRSNQNPGLTILQIIFLKEHNRIANDLSTKINPHWDDQTIFEEARRINIAQVQHITYYEWLPLILGTENMLRRNLIYRPKNGDYINDYDPTVNPSVLNSHATAVSRYFHSQIEGHLDLFSENRTQIKSLRLSDWYNKPELLEKDDNFDSLLRGLSTQLSELTDTHFDPEAKHFLFRRESRIPFDLRAIDIQRARDHGLASYNDYREICGLKRTPLFFGMVGLIAVKNILRMHFLYGNNIDDLELSVAGSVETHVKGTMIGPTFLCIMIEQFYRTRVGDRFFYERGGDKDISFTKSQLREIRKTTLSRILCDSGNNIQNMQPHGFLQISKINQLVPCSTLPTINLSSWKDKRNDK